MIQVRQRLKTCLLALPSAIDDTGKTMTKDWPPGSTECY